MSKRILVLLGNPDKETYSGQIANTYEESARAAGHMVERVNISELNFDPILHKGYKEISLDDFKIDRNHPDREIYRTDSMSNLMSY